MDSHPLLSIIMASYRPENLRLFFKNLMDTAKDPSSFEVLIKVDTEDQATQALVIEYQKQAPFILKYIVTPRQKGAYSMHGDYNRLLSMAHTNSYFCVNLTDEIRFETKHWDAVLKQYIKLFPDDVFRLEISNNKARNYYGPHDCFYNPDNYPIITKKWLFLTGGWGDYWGTDSWQGLLNFHLGRGMDSANRDERFFRSIPIFDIQISGDQSGKGDESQQSVQKRHRMGEISYEILVSKAALENFLRLSLRLRAHIIAYQKQLTHYEIKEDFAQKTLTMLFENHVIEQFSFKYHIDEDTLEKREVTPIHQYQVTKLLDVIPSSYTKILEQINALE